MTKAQHGSGHLASGAYGCVMYPPAKCDGNANRKSSSYKHSVGKIFSTVYLAADEHEKQMVVEKIDPKSHFTLPLLRQCLVKRFTGMDSCKFDKDKDGNSPDQDAYPQLLYAYGGPDLGSFVDARMDATPSKKFKAFMKLFNSLGPLFKGLDKLGKAGYAHLDIKPANILYNGKKASLIDFGLMDHKHSIFTSDTLYLLKYDYPFYPPEFKLYALARASTKPPSFAEFKTTFMKNFAHMRTLPPWSSASVDKSLKPFYNTIRFQTDGFSEAKLDHEMNTFDDQVDSYSLGMTLHIIYEYLELDMVRESELVHVFIERLVELNPYFRLDVHNAYLEYKRIKKIYAISYGNSK